jgi:hypothetical protein
MGESTARLQRLMQDGFRIEAIDSDEEAIVATLRRGQEFVVLHFGREEAADLLFLEQIS